MRWAGPSIALLLAVPLAGCLDSGELGDRWDDLEVRDRFHEVSLLLEKREFSFAGAFDPANPPSSPDEFGERWTGFFTVPLGTRSMSLTYNVRFENTTPPQVPVEAPKGSITIDLASPGEENENQHVVLSDSAGGGFDYRQPSPGEWEVRYTARGNGDVAFNATAQVPVNATVNASGDGSSAVLPWT